MRAPRALLAVAAGMVGLVGSAAPVVQILAPHPSSFRTADAVVVFFGGEGERLARAEDLMDAKVAPVLVLSTGDGSRWPGRALCGQRHPYRVVCVDPSPISTQGEARAFGRLASQAGWHRLVAVTTTTHVRRAELLLDRCTDAHVGMVDGHGMSPLHRPSIVLHEWVGLAWAALVARSC